MSNRDTTLAGHRALIVGVGGGLGRITAHAFAVRGADVVLSARSIGTAESVRDELRALGYDGHPIAIDARDEQSVVAGVQAAASPTGTPPDIVVCCAGIAGPTARLVDSSHEEWSTAIDVNIGGTVRVIRAVLPSMIERRRGSIVVIGSMTGKRALANRTAYATSKMGLVGLVRSLAAEVGPDGVRVNLVSPGPVAGARLQDVIQAQATARATSYEQAEKVLLADSMLGGAVPAGDVADTVAFLASDHAASITGEDINVSRGIVCY